MGANCVNSISGCTNCFVDFSWSYRVLEVADGVVFCLSQSVGEDAREDLKVGVEERDFSEVFGKDGSILLWFRAKNHVGVTHGLTWLPGSHNFPEDLTEILPEDVPAALEDLVSDGVGARGCFHVTLLETFFDLMVGDGSNQSFIVFLGEGWFDFFEELFLGSRV